MSYLDLPRLTFSGQFLADPSTLNNTPNNFNSNHTFPTAATVDDNLFTSIDGCPPQSYNNNNIDLFWNPNGTGSFALVDCSVQTVTYADGTSESSAAADPIIGQPVVSNGDTKSPFRQAKLVDLDPMQQNTSEIWGMNVGIGDLFSAKFVEASFIAIWLQAKEVPPGDTAGSALYQSILENLEPGSSGVESKFLSDIAGRKNLSISFTVRACNSAPLNYLISDKTLAIMNQRGVSKAITTKLEPLKAYASHPSSVQGQIPTTSYFLKLVNEILGGGSGSGGGHSKDNKNSKDNKDNGNDPVEIIADVAKQPYTPATPYPFVHGQVVGVIGPQDAGEPVHFPAARMLAPSPDLPPPKFGPYDPLCNFTPFKVIEQGKGSALVVNFGNSLPTITPASAFYGEKLGTLRLCYFDVPEGGKISTANATVLPGVIDYADTENFFNRGAGLVDLPIDSELAGKPLGVVRIDEKGAVDAVILQEDALGYYLRADKFVYRMQPGDDSAEQAIDIYVTRFGAPAPGETVEISLKSPDDTVSYTNNTPGTGGSPGVLNLAVPQSAVTIENPETKTDAKGKATVKIKASDPGNPRDYLNGQIYYLNYKLKSAGAGYLQSPDDIISLQVYQQDPQSLLIPGNSKDNQLITWNNGVRDILSQYDKLYPIMSFMDLGNYETVTEPDNLSSIKSVLEADISDPAHMPVTRDLSSSRRNVILSWIENGTPEG